MFYNVSTDDLFTIFLFFCVLSPIFILLLAFLANTLLRFNINNLKRNSTSEQFQEYIDKYNWKYSVEFFFPQLKSKTGPGRKLTYSPIYFTQVSESDAEFFKDWVSCKDGSFLELKDFTGHVTKVNRNYMSLIRVRLEAVPHKLISKELYAIYEKDSTLRYSFEGKQMENNSKKRSKLWIIPIIPIICSLFNPLTGGLIILFVIDCLLWTSCNMTYLFKTYPLCRVRKLNQNQNVDFFKK